MKRNHRRWHRLAWLLLTPFLAAAIALALALRQPEPHNTGLPAVLVAPPDKQGG